MQSLWFGLAILILSACASIAPQAPSPSAEPAWLSRGVRFTEGGRIIYVGAAGGLLKDGAISRAEGSALEDIANECSLIPKSTRIDSRYSVRGTYEYEVHVKLSVDAGECEMAKQAVEPAQIHYYASTPLTRQLLQAQDRVENVSASSLVVVPPRDLPQLPERDSHWDDTQHFYASRQALAYLKQIPVLAPDDAYAPFSPQSRQFAAAVQMGVQRLNSMQINNPSLKEKPMAWSQLPERPRYRRPDVLLKRLPEVQKGRGS
ncbi:MAG: hypothetical protein KF799_00170 [Bdellovibrionales bacterium]|nr:hypothetical protein [Bdellovibrionales bacterium]